MKRTRLLSALLAVMMVISMMACIAVPAMAIGTLPADAVHISTITEKVTTGRNIYLETPADFVAVANAHANKYLYYLDTIYLKNDIDMSTYVSPTAGNAFKDDFTPLTYNKSGAVNWNGLGHTIYNWTEDSAIYGEYGFENNTGAPTSIDVSFKNINMVGATITGGVGAVLLAKSNADGGYGGNITIENCHIYNCTASSAANYYTAGLIGRVDGDERVTITVKDCSVVGNTISLNPASATAKTEANGLFIGRAECKKVTVENCLAANNTIGKLTAGATNSSGGLVVGDAKVCTEGYVFNNIALINNTIEVLGDCYDALLVNPYGTASSITATNIYAVGNVKSTDSAANTDDVAIKAWVDDSANKNATVTLTNCVSDGATYDVYTSAEDCVAAPAERIDSNLTTVAVIDRMNASATYADWGFDANGTVALLETDEKAPVAVSFTKKDVTTTYYTDVNGKIAVKADLTKVSVDELAALAEAAWSDGTNEVAKGADWANMTFTAATAYNKTSHDLSYTAGANNTHDVVCDTCDAHTVTGVACTPVAVPENDVAASYFAKAKKAYKCEFCTNTWFEDDADSTFAAPYTLTFDQEGYRNNDTEVKVTLTPKADANMSGMNLDLAFSADYLDYVEYAPSAATVVVNEVTEGNLVIAMVKADGTTLTEADAITLTFKVQGLSNSVINAALTATATLTKATVGTGNDFAVAEALTKTVTATSAASYLDFEAGDVNSDGYVDLLDAVLIIQKLNGTIGTAQDAAFKLIAADVNNSGDVNTADVTLVLQYVCEMDVTFTPATQEPTIVVVGA